MTIEDAEVRVASVPACAYLLCLNFTPLGVVQTPRGSVQIPQLSLQQTWWLSHVIFPQRGPDWASPHESPRKPSRMHATTTVTLVPM